MTLDQSRLIAIAAIISVTLIGVIALTRNTNIKINLNFGANPSITIEGKYSPPKTNDRLPSGESSHILSCDS
jgi:hypothetical protein